MVNAVFKHVWNWVRILWLFVFELVVGLLAFVVVPIALIGLKEEDNHLPRWARMWETYDYDINGDPPWQGPEHANGKQNTYWWRLRWLLRNRAGTFSYEILGLQLEGDVKFYLYGDYMTSNREPAHSGFMYAEAWVNGKMYPCYYWVRQWEGTSRCIRLYAGWKFRHARPVDQWPTTGLVSYACAFNPVMGFE